MCEQCKVLEVKIKELEAILAKIKSDPSIGKLEIDIKTAWKVAGIIWG